MESKRKTREGRSKDDGKTVESRRKDGRKTRERRLESAGKRPEKRLERRRKIDREVSADAFFQFVKFFYKKLDSIDFIQPRLPGWKSYDFFLEVLFFPQWENRHGVDSKKHHFLF